MEKKTKSFRKILIIAIVDVAIAAAICYVISHSSAPKFCFDFSHNMQFGDRKVDHPVNVGSIAGGNIFYIPEVPALQEALKRQGFYIDPFETTGGKVYAAAFFGPSTRSAVMAFQKKYSLPQTGQVTDDTIDKLSQFYKCPTHATSTQDFVVGTTTPKGK